MKFSDNEIILMYLVNKHIEIDNVFFDIFCREYYDYINRVLHCYDYKRFKNLHKFYMKKYREYMQKILNEKEV